MVLNPLTHDQKDHHPRTTIKAKLLEIVGNNAWILMKLLLEQIVRRVVFYLFQDEIDLER
jgi:hypothetical protein